MSEQNLSSPTQTNTLAIVSLVSGIAGWTVVPFFGAILAVVTGHMARREIQQSAEPLEGEGVAIAGLYLGYGCLGVTVLAVCAVSSLLLLGLFPIIGGQ